jgi:hypothetical protein
MGKQNVQNLISFYLNADMYRQYARKELIRNSNESTSPGKLTLAETREALKEFAKGLINSYLLSANNFTSNGLDVISFFKSSFLSKHLAINVI